MDPRVPEAGGLPSTGPLRAPASPPRKWLVLAVMCVSLLLCGIDLTVLHVAVPSLTRDLRPTGVELLWIVDVYSLTLAALLVTCGTLGDRVGRKRLVLSGFALFGAASAAAAMSTTTAQLIAARMALGAGAAMIMASTVAIIRVVFPDDRERALAIGIWTAAHSAGATLGPLVGGALLEKWWWGSVFLINVPIIAVILVVGAKVIPESRNPVPRRWDLASVALSVTGLACVVYALKQAGEYVGVNAVILVLALAGTSLLFVFVRRQYRLAQPLLDFSLFAERRFTAAIVCILFCFGGYTAMLFFLTQSFQLVDGYSPLQAGLSLMPLAAANAVGAVTAPWAARVWGNRWTMTGALVVFGTALSALTVVGGSGAYVVVVVSLVAAGYGAGVVMTLGADVIMSAADPNRAGEAAAIQETSFELGAGMGIAVLGTALAATYRVALPDVPGVTDEDQEAARESIGAASEVADALDPQVAGRLIDAARDAYTQGFTTVTALAAAGLFLTALLAAVMLRPVPRTGAVSGQQPLEAGDTGARGVRCED